MTFLNVSNLKKSFRAKSGSVTVIDDLDLDIHDGELLVLLGPSGCGKTTTLRCLAGLETPDSGRISFDDRAAFDGATGVNVPPDKRSIGVVFQSYALWPHMTVRKNIEYPLKRRGLKEKIADGWVDEAAELVDCLALLDRYPAQLSGGQQQRVALARGLVARPDLVLFDEPLSNLDTRLRDSVRSQLHELHRSLGFTGVFVTHDQSEALALGTRMAIMNKGRIEQIDTPPEVFERPATDYVADFIGMTNGLSLTYSDGVERIEGIPVAGETLMNARADSATVRLRPDDIVISTPGEEIDGMNAFEARVVDVTYGGRHLDVMVAAGQRRIHVRTHAGERDSWQRRLKPGANVNVTFGTRDARLFGQDGRAMSDVALTGASA